MKKSSASGKRRAAKSSVRLAQKSLNEICDLARDVEDQLERTVFGADAGVLLPIVDEAVTRICWLAQCCRQMRDADQTVVAYADYAKDPAKVFNLALTGKRVVVYHALLGDIVVTT